MTGVSANSSPSRDGGTNCLVACQLCWPRKPILLGPVEQAGRQKGNKRYSKDCNKCSNKRNITNAKRPLHAVHSLPSKNKELNQYYIQPVSCRQYTHPSAPLVPSPFNALPFHRTKISLSSRLHKKPLTSPSTTTPTQPSPEEVGNTKQQSKHHNVTEQKTP